MQTWLLLVPSLLFPSLKPARLVGGCAGFVGGSRSKVVLIVYKKEKRRFSGPDFSWRCMILGPLSVPGSFGSPSESLGVGLVPFMVENKGRAQDSG